MIDIIVEIEKIELLLKKYYDSNSEDEQANEGIKNKIKELIIAVHEETAFSETEKQKAISSAMTLLSENTGCAEDYEIAEAILHELFDERKIINQKNIDDFYGNSPINRWM